MEYWHVRGCCAGPRFRWSRRSLDSRTGGCQCGSFVCIEAGITEAFYARCTMRRLRSGLDRGLAVPLRFGNGVSLSGTSLCILADAVAFTGQGKLLRKATGYEHKKLKPRYPAFAGCASRTA